MLVVTVIPVCIRTTCVLISAATATYEFLKVFCGCHIMIVCCYIIDVHTLRNVSSHGVTESLHAFLYCVMCIRKYVTGFVPSEYYVLDSFHDSVSVGKDTTTPSYY